MVWGGPIQNTLRECSNDELKLFKPSKHIKESNFITERSSSRDPEPPQPKQPPKTCFHFLCPVQEAFPWVAFQYCPPPWIIFTIWFYIALNRTPNIDCYWVGAVPKVACWCAWALLLSKKVVGYPLGGKALKP